MAQFLNVSLWIDNKRLLLINFQWEGIISQINSEIQIKLSLHQSTVQHFKT